MFSNNHAHERKNTFVLQKYLLQNEKKNRTKNIEFNFLFFFEEGKKRFAVIEY